jgi:hypothetical protein
MRPTQHRIQWVPGVLEPEGKARPESDANHSPHVVQRPGMRRYTLPLSACMECSGTALLYFIILGVGHWVR